MKILTAKVPKRPEGEIWCNSLKNNEDLKKSYMEDDCHIQFVNEDNPFEFLAKISMICSELQKHPVFISARRKAWTQDFFKNSWLPINNMAKEGLLEFNSEELRSHFIK